MAVDPRTVTRGFTTGDVERGHKDVRNKDLKTTREVMRPLASSIMENKDDGGN